MNSSEELVLRRTFRLQTDFYQVSSPAFTVQANSVIHICGVVLFEKGVLTCVTVISF